jgi:hypothetical protein
VVVPGEENMDLARFRLHLGSILHTQGEAVIGDLHDFGLQPNHNFFTNIGSSSVVHGRANSTNRMLQF